MHLTIVKSDLLRLLDLARTFSDKDPPKPILRNALLSVVEAGEHQLLRVTASDLFQTLTVHAQCAAAELGSVALSAKAMHDVVSALPEGPVELSVDGTRLAVGAGRRRARIPFEDGNDFPRMPEPDPDVPPVTINASTLVSLIERVYRCASTDLTRPEYSSVLLEIGDGQAQAVALDGRALAVARDSFAGEGGRVAVVPIKAAKRLLAALEKHQGQVLVHLARSEQTGNPDLLFQFGSVQFATKRVERDRYPGFEMIIDQERPHAVVVPRKALVDSCSAARKVLDGDEFPKVTFGLSGGELELSVVSASGRAYSDTIAGVDHERPVRWAMNLDCLTSVLTSMAAESVELRYIDGINTFGVTVPGDDSYVAVVSPCQM